MEVRALFGRFVWRRVNIDDITIHPSRGSRIKPALKVCEHNRVAHASKSINISTFVYLWNRVTTLNVLPKYSSMLYWCNLSAGVALNARFTTNWMCAKNNYIYVARTINNRVNRVIATWNRVPTFGEFVPRLGISATFGEKSRDLVCLGIFGGNCIVLGLNWETLWPRYTKSRLSIWY